MKLWFTRAAIVAGVSVLLSACPENEPECGATGVCPGGLVCVEGECLRPCNRDAECAGALERCVDGVCKEVDVTTECVDETDSGCAENAHCEAGDCVDDLADGSECDEPSDCISGNCSEAFVLGESSRCAPASTCWRDEGPDPIGFVRCAATLLRTCEREGDWGVPQSIATERTCDAGGGSGSGYESGITCTSGVGGGLTGPGCQSCAPYFAAGPSSCAAACDAALPDAFACWPGFFCAADAVCHDGQPGDPCVNDDQCVASLCDAGVCSVAVTSAVSGEPWQSFRLPAHRGTLSFEFDITPDASPIGTVIGVGSRIANDYAHTMARVRFPFNSSEVDAYDADAYRYDEALTYAAGSTYHVRMEVRIPERRFSAYVRELPGGNEVAVARGYRFEASQLYASEVRYWSVRTNSTTATSAIDNVQITAAGTLHTYEVGRAASAPAIDGDLSEWSEVPVIQVDNPGTPARASYRMLWDDSALYIAMDITDPDLHAAGATYADQLWRDDGTEVLFNPQMLLGETVKTGHWKIIATAADVFSLREGFDPRRELLNTVGSGVAVADGTVNNTSDTDNGYRVELAVDFAAWLGAAPVAGDRWGFEVVSNDRDVSGSRTYVQWANTDSPDSDPVNDPDGWGVISFAGESFTSDTTWRSLAVGEQPGVVTVEYDWEPSSTSPGSVVGLGPGLAWHYGGTAAVLRMENGIIDAIDGGGYATPETTVDVVAGQLYRARFVVRIPEHRYCAHVGAGSQIYTIGRAFGFRQQQAAADAVSFLSAVASDDTATVSNLATHAAPYRTYVAMRAPVPVVADGQLGEFAEAVPILLDNPSGASHEIRLLWDDAGLYVAVQASDVDLLADGATFDEPLGLDDGIGLGLDPLFDLGRLPRDDDWKLEANIAGAAAMENPVVGRIAPSAGSIAVVNDGSLNDAQPDVGYTMELIIPWGSWAMRPELGTTWGLELVANDRPATGTVSSVVWSRSVAYGSSDTPDGFGALVFGR